MDSNNIGSTSVEVISWCRQTTNPITWINIQISVTIWRHLVTIGSSFKGDWDMYNIRHFVAISNHIYLWFRNRRSQRTHDAIKTSLLRQNDVATSFWCNNDVIITSCVRWDDTEFHYINLPSEWSGSLWRIIMLSERTRLNWQISNYTKDRSETISCLELLHTHQTRRGGDVRPQSASGKSTNFWGCAESPNKQNVDFK